MEEAAMYPSLLTPPSDSPEAFYTVSPSHSSGSNVFTSQGFSNANQYEMPNSLRLQRPDQPFLKIIEQPQERFRFRYKSEMAGLHGSLTGRSSERRNKQSYPTVKLFNFNQKAVIRCSVYQHAKDEFTDSQPHAHRLVRKAGVAETDDPHNIIVGPETDYTAGFHSMGIIHTARRYIVSELVRKKTQLLSEKIAREEGRKRNLKSSELLEIENESENQVKQINLNIVRLRFDAFEERNGILYPLCPPVYSKTINNLKSAQTCDLKIVRMDHCSSPCRGNREIFLLVEKVTKNNIKVRFFELNDDDETIWEAYGIFSGLDVHHQYAIVFRTPPYRDVNCNRHVRVYMELVRPSDGARSEPKEFTYTPCDPVTGRKRPRTTYINDGSFEALKEQEDIPVTINEEIEQALKENELSFIEKLLNDLESKHDVVDFSNTFVNFPQFETDNVSEQVEVDVAERILSDEEKKIAVRVYKELDSFLKTNPSAERKQSMAKHLFKKYRSAAEDTPFHLALYGQSKKLLLLLMRLLSDNPPPCVINAKNITGDTLLHAAVETGVVCVVNFLIFRKADLSIQNSEGNTPLQLCVKCENECPRKQHIYGIILNNLLMDETQVKKFIDIENHAGNTALITAIENNKLATVKKLCLKGADVNKRHMKNGFTPLHIAIDQKNFDMVNSLLETESINVQVFDFKDFSPYKMAINMMDIDENCRKICHRLEEYLRNNGITDLVEVKEEATECSDEEMIKLEPMSPSMDCSQSEYPSQGSFSPECLDLVAKCLDNSGNWKHLAELLDMDNFLQIEAVNNYDSPTKALINLAMANGESVDRIRDFLEHLDEPKAVNAMNDMLRKDSK